MEKQALEFARKAHGEQRRKYIEELYIEHPKRVAGLVKTVPHSVEMVCAAYLHDVVEDTPVSIQDIQRRFGRKVALLVDELTDVYIPENYPNLNRKIRKQKEVARLASISVEAKTIKLADVIDNTQDILDYDRNFARRYIPEMVALTEALQGGHFNLLLRACYQVQKGLYVLNREIKEISQ